MPDKVYTLTETTDRSGSGFVIGVFADLDQAIDAARSNAAHQIRRCIASEERLFNTLVAPGTYEAVLLRNRDDARLVIRHRPSGEQEWVAWHISPFEVIEPRDTPFGAAAHHVIPAD
jgi:hypothetical protein